MALPILRSPTAILFTLLLVLLSMASVQVHARSSWARLLRGRSMVAPAVPPTVTITGVRAAGSGCPNSTPLVTISGDKKAVTIPFKQFHVSVPAARLSDKERACTVTVNLDYPAGWSYIGTKWVYQGWVELDASLEAHLYSHYWYSGTPNRNSCKADHVFAGGADGLDGQEYQIAEECRDAVTWSPCGQVRGFNALTRLWIDNRNNPTGMGTIKSEAADGEVIVYQLHVDWQYCTNN